MLYIQILKIALFIGTTANTIAKQHNALKFNEASAPLSW
jgi:hypothetical protein